MSKDKTKKLESVGRTKLCRASFVIAFMSISITSSPSSLIAGERRDNQKIILEIAHDIEAILIEEKICHSKRECQKGQYYFVSPATNGIGIVTYELTDLRVLSRVTTKASSVFYASDSINIEIENYKNSKKNELKSFFKSDPFIKILMRR